MKEMPDKRSVYVTQNYTPLATVVYTPKPRPGKGPRVNYPGGQAEVGEMPTRSRHCKRGAAGQATTDVTDPPSLDGIGSPRAMDGWEDGPAALIRESGHLAGW